MKRLSPLLLLFSCSQQPTFIPPDDTATETDADTDTDTDADADADADADTDQDGDGWTVEEGDCDDDDIGVNPAREEDPDDGKDNDCDGRVDEEWAGLDVAMQYVWGRSEIVRIDTVSRVDDEIMLDEGFAPTHLAHGLDGGWVFIHDPDPATDPNYDVALNETAALVLADEDGDCTTLAEFESDETEDAYEAGLAGVDDLPVIRGLIAHPDGYYLVARRGALERVDPDGTVTTLATWSYDWGDEDNPFQLYAMDLAYDLLTGEVGIFGFLGGFATWTPADGFVIQKQADLSDGWEHWDAMLVQSGAAMDGGGWYGLLIDYNAYEYGLYGFFTGSGTWSEVMTWQETLILPEQLATNGDNGDFYVTANAGWYHTVWLLRDETDLIDDFYKSESDEGRFFRGVVSAY